MAAVEHPDDGRAVLADLPPALLAVLARGVRRAADAVGTAGVPAALRPFVRFPPDQLGKDARQRQALAAAVAGDARFREQVAEALEDRRAVARAADGDELAHLLAAHDAPTVAAALAVSARWEALAVLAAAEAERSAARDTAARDHDRQRTDQRARSLADRRAEELTVVRRERDDLRRRADDLQRRVRAAEGARAEAERALATAQAELAKLRADATAAARDAAGREDRLRRRVDAAAQRARVDAVRLADALDRLDAVAGELRASLPAGQKKAAAGPALAAPGAPPPEPTATPGRPATLPPGLRSADPDGVRALLRAPGMVVLLDGYNVTKDTRGLPGGTLAEQRRWLLGEAATVAARFDAQVVVVFDGAEYRPGEVRPPRGVRVVFSEPPEIGDDRIEALLRERPRTPTLVVSSDRDVQARATAVDANVTTAAAFLRAVGRSGPPTERA